MKMSIGKNIKAMRRKCGFTQEELAERLAVTPQAVSKWENDSGLPDITQLVPLAQIFGISTDSLLGAESASYGEAHTHAAENHVRLLLDTSQSDAEKYLAIYTYLRAEAEREPTNYTLMRMTIEAAAEISRYADFEGFLNDRAELRDEIFADCERKNACIARYCEEQANIEKSDYAAAWICIHTKQFDKAQALIGRLPSLESSCLREQMTEKLVFFRDGFVQEKPVIAENLRKLLRATAKEFFSSFENYVWSADPAESIAMSRNMLAVLDSYRAFDGLEPDVLAGERRIRSLLPKCFAAQGDAAEAGNEICRLAECTAKLAESGIFADADAAKSDAKAALDAAICLTDMPAKIKATAGYQRAMAIIDKI